MLWAAILGGATVLYRLVSIVIWFERRPGAFLVCELSRPALALTVVTVLLAVGSGLEAVLIGTAAGSLLAAVVGLIVLRHSFEPDDRLRRGRADPPAGDDPQPDHDVVLGDGERGRLRALAVRQRRRPRRLHARLADRLHRGVPAAGIPRRAAAPPQGGDLQGGRGAVRPGRAAGPAPGVLRPPLHQRCARDGGPGAASRGGRARLVRGCGAADPADGGARWSCPRSFAP